METRSNNILIGAFILAGLLLGVAATLWLSRTGDAGAKKQFYVVFMGSVQGLAPKAPVLFNGLRVGEVDEITLNPGNPTEIRTRITVEARTPVRRDTGARLTFQGLTGVAAVELSGGTEAAGDLVPGPDGVPPAMFTDRAAAANLFEGGQDTLGRINAVVGRLDALIVANQASINASIRNVQTFTDALAANSQAVSTLLADASTAARRIADLSARLEAVAEAVDPRKVGEIVDGAASVVSAVAAQREDIRTLIADASRAARNVAEAAERLAPSLRRAEDILTAVDPAAIGRIVAGAERSVAGIERFSTAVGAQAERIPRLAEDATEAMASLRRATGAFESLAGSAGGAGQGGAGGVMDEFVQTARSIRTTSDNLDRRIAEISANLSRFTGPGLRDLQNLIADGRRTLANMDRVFRDLERNPQQFIFGRAGVPEFRR